MGSHPADGGLSPVPLHLTEAASPFALLQASARQIQAVQDVAQSADAGQCQIPGKVDDLSDCTYSAVHSLNHRHVNPVVRELVKTAFFRYFKASVSVCRCSPYLYCGICLVCLPWNTDKSSSAAWQPVGGVHLGQCRCCGAK